jgi:glycosyltransferase involved in cell wall biosynthesis
MIDRTNVAALIPAFREEMHIADVVRSAKTHLDIVLVIDDGSPDATSAEAERADAKVIRHEANRGKGAAIKTGLRELLSYGVKYALILDGDGQHNPGEIPDFLAAANNTGAPFLLGNRMSDAVKMPPVRRLTNRLMSWQISRVCRQSIPDTQCGFRMIHHEVIPYMFCECNAYDYETEMILIASREGYEIQPVPVSTVYGAEVSKIHPVTDTLRFIKLMAKYRGKIF